jgi:hypothetical protein
MKRIYFFSLFVFGVFSADVVFAEPVHFSRKPVQLACEVTACQTTCAQIRSNCYKRGGALVNCEEQAKRCDLNCATGCK